MEPSPDEGTAATPSSTARWSSLHTFLFLAPALFLLLALFGRAGRLGLGRVCVQTSPEAASVLGIVAVGCFLALLWFGRRWFRWWVTGLVWILAVNLFFAAGVLGGLALLFSRSEVCRGAPGGGVEVALLYSGLFQGREVELAEVLADNALFRAYRVVAIHRDPESPAALLVRPERRDPGEDWQIHGTSDGFVAGFHHGMYCVVAFEPSTGRSWGSAFAGDSGDSVNELPPFRLLESTGRPSPADVMLLEGFATRDGGTPAGERRRSPMVDNQSLLDALGHPNPGVREAARVILDAGGPELYPRGGKARK